jgi:uncharacterized protein
MKILIKEFFMIILEAKGLFFIKNEMQEIVAKIVYHFDERGSSVVTSTYVNPSLRGQGIANQLMNKIIQLAKDEKRLIGPECSFALKVLSQPALVSLIDPRWRA